MSVRKEKLEAFREEKEIVVEDKGLEKDPIQESQEEQVLTIVFKVP